MNTMDRAKTIEGSKTLLVITPKAGLFLIFNVGVYASDEEGVLVEPHRKDGDSRSNNKKTYFFPFGSIVLPVSPSSAFEGGHVINAETRFGWNYSAARCSVGEAIALVLLQERAENANAQSHLALIRAEDEAYNNRLKEPQTVTLEGENSSDGINEEDAI